MALEHPVILTSESDIARAWMATPSVVAEITGREDIPLEAYKQEPQGDRITVLRDRHPTTWGGVLHIPESAKELTIISVGLIIGVGPEAGSQTHLSPQSADLSTYQLRCPHWGGAAILGSGYQVRGRGADYDRQGHLGCRLGR